MRKGLYVYIRLGDRDIVEGFATAWKDDSDVCGVTQVTVDGKEYTTSYSNIVVVTGVEMEGT